MLLSHFLAGLALVPSLLAAGGPADNQATGQQKRYNPWVPPTIANEPSSSTEQLESRAKLEAAGRSNLFWAGQGFEAFPVAHPDTPKVKLGPPAEGKGRASHQNAKRAGHARYDLLTGAEAQKRSGPAAPGPTQVPVASPKNKVVRRSGTGGTKRNVRLVVKRQQANAQCVVTVIANSTTVSSATATANATSAISTAGANSTSVSVTATANSTVLPTASANSTTTALTTSVTSSASVNATDAVSTSAKQNATIPATSSANASVPITSPVANATSAVITTSAAANATSSSITSSSVVNATSSWVSSSSANSTSMVSTASATSPIASSTAPASTDLASSTAPSSTAPSSTAPSTAPASSIPASSSTASSSSSSSVASTTTSVVFNPSATTTAATTAATTATVATSSAAPSPAPSAWSSGDPSGTNGPFSGWGTWFDVGLGACGWWNNPQDPIVAISEQLYNSWPGATANPNNNPICSKHLEVCYGSVCTLAQVADMCPGCAPRSLDMSRGLFEHFASLDVGLFANGYTQNITWNWVPGTGALPPLPLS